MPAQKKFILATPVNVPRDGLCSECGKKFKLGGNNMLGYKVPTHHSSDIEKAQQGENCLGSDEFPSEVL